MSNFGNLLFSVGAEGSSRGLSVFWKIMGRKVGGAGRKQFFSVSAHPFTPQPLRLRRPVRCRSIHASAVSFTIQPLLLLRQVPAPPVVPARRPVYPPLFMHIYCMKLQYVNDSFSGVGFHNRLIYNRRVLGVKSCHFLSSGCKKCGKTTFCCHFATFLYMKNFTFGGVLVAICYLYQETPYLFFIEGNIDFAVTIPCAMLPLPAVSARSALSLYALLFSL